MSFMDSDIIATLIIVPIVCAVCYGICWLLEEWMIRAEDDDNVTYLYDQDIEDDDLPY